MIDQTLQQQIEEAAAARRQVEEQQRIADQAATLPALEKEAARQIAIAQTEQMLDDAKLAAVEAMPELKQRVDNWHDQVAQLEKLLADVTQQREALNNEIRNLALSIKRPADYLQSISGYNPENEFHTHWSQIGGETFNLNAKPEIDQIINSRKSSFYTGRSAYFNNFGRFGGAV